MTMVTTAKIMKAGEFKAKCLELMDQVAASGDSIVITKRGKPVAKLGPVVERPETLAGFFKDKIKHIGDVVTPVAVDWGPAEPEIQAKRRGRER
jgi:prevent-host-death family protein